RKQKTRRRRNNKICAETEKTEVKDGKIAPKIVGDNRTGSTGRANRIGPVQRFNGSSRTNRIGPGQVNRIGVGSGRIGCDAWRDLDRERRRQIQRLQWRQEKNQGLMTWRSLER
ncbi:hypothetical protein PIB30_054750, partial [Stylosanthes scabra]|nr:hypothetical protein [Stylosanthes scabra]